MTTGKLAGTATSGRLRQSHCLGFDRVERSYQPRFIALSIVPGHVKELDHSSRQLNTLQTVVPSFTARCVLPGKPGNRREKYGQAARLISTSKLNVSLRFHTWPINLVVYQEPSEVLRPGRSHLVEGFTLRCLQRFSLPDVATRRCRWRDNRYTRGPSNPVLSY
jgi:hypothetical protein